MTGLKFTYDSGDYLKDVWETYRTSEWVTHEIPEGYQIIGMFVDFCDYSYCEGKEQFGFKLGKSEYWS